jgi:ATP-dependent Lon protease
LNTVEVEDTVKLVLEAIKIELEVTKQQIKISAEIEENYQIQHKKYFLNEQLKSIKKELGLEKDEKTQIIQKFEKKIEGKKVKYF